MKPRQGCLALHRLERQYNSFAAFQPELIPLMRSSEYIQESVEVIRQLGIIEPFTDRHIRPEEVLISSQNYRESLVVEGCLSRHRAVLRVLEKLYGTPADLDGLQIFLAEALSGFARKIQCLLPDVVLSEFLEDVPEQHSRHGIRHEDLCALSFSNMSFDLVITNEVFEHVPSLEMALAEIYRVLRPRGRMVCTFPFAYGQQEPIQKAIHYPEDGRVELLTEPELHIDPLRPDQGAMVYQVPGWSILDQAREVGFSKATMHTIASWKHGVLGSEIPVIFVMEAER